MANPTTLLTQAIANTGTKNILPNTTTAPGAMSQALGFPPECSVPLDAGGYAPQRADVNGAFFMLSQYAMAAQRGIVWQYDATVNYEAPAFVQDPYNNGYYFCVGANGPDTTVMAPHSDTSHTYWNPIANVILNTVYPVGAIYLSVNAVDPGTLFGGTWEQITGKFLLASSATHTIGSTGGDENLAVHNHGITVRTASITHNHSASGTATNNGMHAHTGTTSTNGNHQHLSAGDYPHGGRMGAYGGTDYDNEWEWPTSFAGTHNHAFLTDSGGGHTHNVSVTVNNNTNSHNHTATCANAGTGTGGNMPPYLTVNVWKRTA